MHRPNSSPALLPENFSRIGITTSRIVPGSMVLRMTITGAPACVAIGLADLLAHALHVREVDAAVRLARRADADEREVGVAHRVAPPRWWRESRPAATCSRMMSPMSFSMIGELARR